MVEDPEERPGSRPGDRFDVAVSAVALVAGVLLLASHRPLWGWLLWAVSIAFTVRVVLRHRGGDPEG